MPKPEVRQRVRALAESQWREPVVAVYLEEVRPSFDVPGRRKDGTVKGKRLVRRFFRNIVRGAIGVPIEIFLSIAGGGVATLFAREGTVTGPENAQALELVDAAMRADSPWLVYSPSHVAVVDTGRFYNSAGSQPPVFLWHAAKPYAPQVSHRRRSLTWPDGSVFEHHLSWGDDNLPAAQPE